MSVSDARKKKAVRDEGMTPAGRETKAALANAYKILSESQIGRWMEKSPEGYATLIVGVVNAIVMINDDGRREALSTKAAEEASTKAAEEASTKAAEEASTTTEEEA